MAHPAPTHKGRSAPTPNRVQAAVAGIASRIAVALG
jgi:hypothetical protein